MSRERQLEILEDQLLEDFEIGNITSAEFHRKQIQIRKDYLDSIKEDNLNKHRKDHVLDDLDYDYDAFNYDEYR